ncbi:MAG: ribonuclease III [Hyphomicrobiaceae bacterium]
MFRRERRYGDLEKVLGLRFKDAGLIERALTHASAKSPEGKAARGRRQVKAGGKGDGAVARFDNERLEFLGDRVLGLAVADMLNELYPSAREGELARRFNLLVRGETCADIARATGLGVHLVLSASEEASGGREKETILADAMEAVLGAIFLMSGFERAREVVRRLWLPLIGDAPAVIADAKSALQEWAQGRGFALPRYVEVSRTGPDHAPVFVAEVRIKGCDPAQGEGASKRAAEQAAATALLAREGIWKDGLDAG